MLKDFVAPALLLATWASATSTPHLIDKRASLDTFVAAERAKALKGVLANIGPNGALATNASRGIIIAGPGIVNPDYRYSWTRDSAMTIHAINEEFFGGVNTLQTTIQDYIYAEANRQTVYNAMGPLYPDGTGLGEPKYNINTTRYNGVWGRPQRDGPALRAISLMEYINYLIQHGYTETAKQVVWPVVLNDLNYVGQYWNETGYDLWEEVAGSSIFTVLAQNRALIQGHHIAHRLGVECTACVAESAQIGCFIKNNFWNATGGFIRANINGGDYRSGIDSASLLASLGIFDIRGSCAPDSYQPCSSRVLATHKVYVDAFREIYALNAKYGPTDAVATGRYPEDTYYGGNPWYICTNAAAEVLYDAAAQFRQQGKLTIDNVSLAFFKQFYPAATVGTFNAPAVIAPGGAAYNNFGYSTFGQGTFGNPADFSRVAQANDFTDIITAMLKYADGFIKVVQTYTPANGSLSEQYDRNDGHQLSAWALTWSFASFLTLAQRRAGQYPPSYNVQVQAGIPNAKICQASSTPGTYAPALMAGAQPVDMSCTIRVTFGVNASTTFGQNIYITGNDSALGNWSPGYEPMVPPNYPIWYSIVQLKPETTYSYSYVHQNSDNYAFEIGNRTITTPACGGAVSTGDQWRGEGTVVYDNFCNPDVTHCW